jgi:hypothetical protein
MGGPIGWFDFCLSSFVWEWNPTGTNCFFVVAKGHLLFDGQCHLVSNAHPTFEAVVFALRKNSFWLTTEVVTSRKVLAMP